MELLRKWRSHWTTRSTTLPGIRQPQRSPRPRLEALEERVVLDTTPLTVLDPNLQVTTVVSSGLVQPIGIVFINNSPNDFLVLEKASGLVKRVTNGVIQPTPALDLAVNSNSERGLLSMTLHPNFPNTPFAYVYWTESSTGADSTAVGSVPLLGNRVDRFLWNPASGTFTLDRNIVQLRARQTDNIAVSGHPGTQNNNENGNHDGGVMAFGPDGKLYVFIGDVGRRGWMQNLPNGPFLTPSFADDTFGGPAPDNAHLSGVVLRLNEDGSTPSDNPFFVVGAAMGGEVGANIQKLYSYGHRNGFGMAFDPQSGSLWLTENADDAYSELNRVIPGMNGGWIQLAGPLSRMSDFKFIETNQFTRALQQVRFPPTRLAYTAALARARMYMLPGATYVDPDLSWRYEIGPAGTVFVQGNALGAEYNGTLWIGSARAFQQVGGNGGSLYRLKLTADRRSVDVSADPRLADRVADNLFRNQKFDGTESETLQIGRGFGTTTDIEQGPDGNLYVVSVTDGAIYKISRIAQGQGGGGESGARVLGPRPVTGTVGTTASVVPVATSPTLSFVAQTLAANPRGVTGLLTARVEAGGKDTFVVSPNTLATPRTPGQSLTGALGRGGVAAERRAAEQLADVVFATTPIAFGENEVF